MKAADEPRDRETEMNETENERTLLARAMELLEEYANEVEVGGTWTFKGVEKLADLKRDVAEAQA